MVKVQERTLLSIKIVDGADQYPERVIAELGSLASKLEHIRKIYLVTTKNETGEEIPLLMMESVGNSERAIDDDAFILDCAMNEIFRENSYDLQLLPHGPWWEQVKPIAQVVRDLNS